MKTFKNAKDYANILIKNIKEFNKKIPPYQQMDSRMIEILEEFIQEKCNKNYRDYIIGRRENYLLTEEELRNLYDKAISKYTDETIESMVDKDLLNISIGETGEILYSLSEKGEKIINKKERERD